MPQPIANNILSKPISGSIERADMSLAIEGEGRDYRGNYSGLEWYSSITPIDGKYVIVSKSVGTGLPTHWVTADATDAELLYTVNRLPDVANSQTFNDTGSALDYLANSDRYIVLRSMPNNSDADGLLLSMDGNILSSYPRTNTTVYDISGNTTNGTLTNGPTFNSNGYWDFDGTDDYLSLGSSAASLVQGKTAVSMGILFKMDSLASLRGLIGTLVYNCGKNLGLVASGTTLSFYNDYNSTCYSINAPTAVSTGKWIFAVGTYDGTTTRIYMIQDGTMSQNSGTAKSGATNTFSSDFRIMGNQYSSYFTDGQGAKAFVYDRVLSESDILQNYYGGPIVTDGLVFAVDASNLVSYESGSTTTYSLTGSLSGSLINGTGYLPNNGGIWNFDGGDDYITQGPSSELDTNVFSVEAFAKLDTFDNTHRTIMARNASVYSHTNGWWFGTLRNGLGSGNNDLRFFMWGDSSYITFSSIGANDGKYHHVVITCDGTKGYFYIDGDLKYSANKPSGNLYNSSTAMTTGRSPDGDYWAGDIPLTRFYDRALTAEEVAQNYNAQKQKYQL